MNVVPDVQRHAVVVDRVLDVPVPARVAVTEVGLAEELPVRHVHQIARNRHSEAHLLDFVAILVLVRPPHAGADVLAGGVDPRPAGRVGPERDAAETAALRGSPRIPERHLVHAASLQPFREIHEHGAGFALVLQIASAERNAVDVQCRGQIELDARRVLQHPEPDGVRAADAERAAPRLAVPVRHDQPLGKGLAVVRKVVANPVAVYRHLRRKTTGFPGGRRAERCLQEQQKKNYCFAHGRFRTTG